MNKIQLLLAVAFTVAFGSAYGQHKTEVTLTTLQVAEDKNAIQHTAEIKGGAGIFEAASRNSNVVMDNNTPQLIRMDNRQTQEMSAAPVIVEKASSKNIAEADALKQAQ